MNNLNQSKEKKTDFILCPKCKYHNKIYNVKHWGTCTGCGEILDKKAKYKYEMYEKLRLWRK